MYCENVNGSWNWRGEWNSALLSYKYGEQFEWWKMRNMDFEWPSLINLQVVHRADCAKKKCFELFDTWRDN